MVWCGGRLVCGESRSLVVQFPVTEPFFSVCQSIVLSHWICLCQRNILVCFIQQSYTVVLALPYQLYNWNLLSGVTSALRVCSSGLVTEPPMFCVCQSIII